MILFQVTMKASAFFDVVECNERLHLQFKADYSGKVSRKKIINVL